MWQCCLPGFFFFDLGIMAQAVFASTCAVLILCLVLYISSTTKTSLLVRSFPSFLQSASQSLGHFLPRMTPIFLPTALGTWVCCPPGVDLAGLA